MSGEIIRNRPSLRQDSLGTELSSSADSLISSKSAGSTSSSAPKSTEHILVFDSAGGASGMEIPSRPASLPLRGPTQSSKQPVKALLKRQKSSERHKTGGSLTPSNATPIPPSRRSSGSSRRSRTPERRTRSPRTPDRSTTASFSAASSTAATLTAMQNVRRRSRTPDAASHKTAARPVSVAGDAPVPMTRNDPLRHSFGRGGTAASSLNIENFSNKNNMLSHITKKRNNNKRQPSPLRGGATNLNATYPQIQYINSTNSSGGRKKGIVLDGGDRNNYEEDDC